MGGFRKTGIYPLNAGVIDDKMLRPSRAFKSEATVSAGAQDVDPLSASASSEKSTEGRLFSPDSRNYMNNVIERGMTFQMWSMSPGCESCTLVTQTVKFVQAIHLLVNQTP